MTSKTITDKLTEYKQLFDDNLISEAEFSHLKAGLLQQEARNTASQPPRPVYETKHMTLFMILGYASAIVALIFIPIGFATSGVVFGAILATYKMSRCHGIILIAVSLLCGILGVMLGIYVTQP